MGVNHCRANVLVTEQFLHGANVVAVRQKVCGEGVPERMTGHPFGQSGLPYGGFDVQPRRGMIGEQAER